MAKLKKQHKVLIVKSLAQFASPKEVQDILAKDHDVSIAYNQLHYYNPERGDSGMSKELTELFYSERNKYLNSTEGATYTYRSYRLRRLSELAEEYRKKRDVLGEIKVIVLIDELMTKELGNKPKDQDDSVSPTLQQINNYLYFDK